MKLVHQAAVLDVQFSADGRRVLTASADNKARIWDASNGSPSTPYLQHSSPIDRLALSSDNRFLMTATAEGDLHLWDAETGQPIPPTVRHGSRTTGIAFSRDGKQVLSAGLDGGVRFWTLPTQARSTPQLLAFARLLSASEVDSTGGLTPVQPSRQESDFRLLRVELPEAFALDSTELARWHRRQAAENERQANWFAARFHLQRLASLEPRDPDLARRLGTSRSNWARIDMTPSGAVATGSYPLRSSDAEPNQIDLSAFYHSPLDQTWHVGTAENHLGNLPRGLVTLAGIEFDVRGVIQLSGRGLGSDRFSEAVRGIPLKLKTRRLHFLHSTGYAGPVPDGTEIGIYLVHFADGKIEEVPIVRGRQVYDWWPGLGDGIVDHANRSVRAWVGTNPARGNVGLIVLSRTWWDNPRPDVEITHLDYVSRMTTAAPFLIAITAER
jgi:hypothetical protein